MWTRKKHDKVVKRLKTIADLKRTMRTFWGAITSFQTQIYAIEGTLSEAKSLLEEISCDIRSMDNDLKQIKEELKKK